MKKNVLKAGLLALAAALVMAACADPNSDSDNNNSTAGQPTIIRLHLDRVIDRMVAGDTFTLTVGENLLIPDQYNSYVGPRYPYPRTNTFVSPKSPDMDRVQQGYSYADSTGAVPDFSNWSDWLADPTGGATAQYADFGKHWNTTITTDGTADSIAESMISQTTFNTDKAKTIMIMPGLDTNAGNVYSRAAIDAVADPTVAGTPYNPTTNTAYVGGDIQTALGIYGAWFYTGTGTPPVPTWTTTALPTRFKTPSVTYLSAAISGANLDRLNDDVARILVTYKDNYTDIRLYLTKIEEAIRAINQSATAYHTAYSPTISGADMQKVAQFVFQLASDVAIAKSDHYNSDYTKEYGSSIGTTSVIDRSNTERKVLWSGTVELKELPSDVEQNHAGVPQGLMQVTSTGQYYVDVFLYEATQNLKDPITTFTGNFSGYIELDISGTNRGNIAATAKSKSTNPRNTAGISIVPVPWRDKIAKTDKAGNALKYATVEDDLAMPQGMYYYTPEKDNGKNNEGKGFNDLWKYDPFFLATFYKTDNDNIQKIDLKPGINEVRLSMFSNSQFYDQNQQGK